MGEKSFAFSCFCTVLCIVYVVCMCLFAFWLLNKMLIFVWSLSLVTPNTFVSDMKSRKWSFLLEDYGKLSEYECLWVLLGRCSLILASHQRCFMSMMALSSGVPLPLSLTIILTLYMSRSQHCGPYDFTMSFSRLYYLPTACLPLWLRVEQRHLFQWNNKQCLA